MSAVIEMTPTAFTKKTVAIVKFGPATSNDGMRPAEYYQVTIDPTMVSPSGEFIRFGSNHGDEINGWQRVAAMTVVEVIGEWEEGRSWEDQKFELGTEAPMMRVAKETVQEASSDEVLMVDWSKASKPVMLE